RLTVTGSTGASQKQSIGDVTLLPELKWQSDHPDVVKVDGPTLTALSAGKATVTVTAGSASASAEVEVGEFNERLIVAPQSLRLKVGESKRLGSDIRLRRGDADFSDQIEATSGAPNIVRYNRDNHSIEGVAAGRADV